MKASSLDFNDDELENSNNKDLIDNDDEKSKNENDKKEIDIENKSEYEQSESKNHTNKIKKINIKKGKNDKKELPDLNKINIDQYRDSISHIAEKEIKNSPKSNLNSGTQSKTINLIRLNQNGIGGTHTNTGPVTCSQANDNYNNRNKKSDK